RIATPALIEILKHDDYLVLKEAAWAVQHIGPQAVKTAVSTLIKALKAESTEVRQTAAFSLGMVDTEAKSVPDLIRMVREDGSARYAATRALGMMGPKAKGAVPTLVEALNKRSWRISDEAAEALKNIDPKAAAKAGVQ